MDDNNRYTRTQADLILTGTTICTGSCGYNYYLLKFYMQENISAMFT